MFDYESQTFAQGSLSASVKKSRRLGHFVANVNGSVLYNIKKVAATSFIAKFYSCLLSLFRRGFRPVSTLLRVDCLNTRWSVYLFGRQLKSQVNDHKPHSK